MSYPLLALWTFFIYIYTICIVLPIVKLEFLQSGGCRQLLFLPTSLSLMVSESSAWPCLAWSCSWRAWSCSSWSWTSLSTTARSALASVSSERRSTSWACRGGVDEKRQRRVEGGHQRRIHTSGQTQHCASFKGTEESQQDPFAGPPTRLYLAMKNHHDGMNKGQF